MLRRIRVWGRTGQGGTGQAGRQGRIGLIDVHTQSRAAGVRVVGLGQVRARAGTGQRVVGAARQQWLECMSCFSTLGVGVPYRAVPRP